LRLAGHLATGAVLAAGVSLLGVARLPRPWLPALVCWWHRGLGRCLGVEVSLWGAPLPGALLAANHVSWLDVPVVGGVAPMRFVSKAEVRQWPLVGWLAALSGTLFLRRGAHQASLAAKDIARQLESGETVVIFPEGTTGDGCALGRFHARLFAAVEGCRAQVQPVAIRYGAGIAPDTTAPFIGDDTLIAHLWRVLRHPGMSVTVHFLPPLTSTDARRRQLADAARAAIAARLYAQPGGAADCDAQEPGRRLPAVT
jgi:1-acyl-sn-glycerol-3-phosphate acyltransferase